MENKKLIGQELKDYITQLQKDKCDTVGQLIDALSKYNPSTKIVVLGADSGGYDVVDHPFCFVVDDGEGEIRIDHCEAKNSELLPYDEYKKKFY